MRNWRSANCGQDSGHCACEGHFEEDRLLVGAADCSGNGAVETHAPCRGTVIEALGGREVSSVLCRSSGRERAYLDDAAGFLVAAGRFAEQVRHHDEQLADRALADPLGAAVAATGRAGPVERIAAETGLALLAGRYEEYEDVLAPHVGPTAGNARLRRRPPIDGRLTDVRELSTGATVRRYERSGGDLDRYHLTPVEATLDDATMATLSGARSLVARGVVSGDGASRRAVRRVTDDPIDTERLGRVLEKHTDGLGVLLDLFADAAVSDVFVNAPVEAQPIGVRVGGSLARTNVRLTRRGIRSLASTFRLRNERAFSRASPTLDATVGIADRTVRVAGTTTPVSDGPAFTFRAHDEEPWTLQQLVRNGTITAAAAGFLSVAIERDCAMLVAGARGAGKTTLLGALLRELPASVRIVIIEDTPELPVAGLQDAGRNVQGLEVTRDGGPGLSPADALHTALRLGEGALVVGEVRGREAAVLYEAMRVGASGSAVLGTIHGDGGDAVRERLVSDLDVPESSFAITDVVVTLEPHPSADRQGGRVRAIEEVIDGSDGVRFGELFALEEGRLAPTGRLQRANSHVIESLASSSESYEDLLAVLREREDRFHDGGTTSEDRVFETPNGTGSSGTPNGTGSTDTPNGTGSSGTPNGTGSSGTPNGTGSTDTPNGTGSPGTADSEPC